MTLIDEIVEVTIRHETSPISQVGLNILLIIGNSKKAGRVKAYSNILEVRSDYEVNTPEYRAAAAALGQKGRPAKILIGQVMSEESFIDAYHAIAKENNDFYGVVITSQEAQDQLAISEVVEAQEKIFGLSSGDPKMLLSNNEEHILHKLHALGRKRTFVIYHGTGDSSYIEAAWFGLMFSYAAGSATWNFKALSGVSADNLSTSERAAITLKNGNCFVRLGANNIIHDGKATSGDWLDATQGLDWLNNMLKTSVANAFSTVSKIPYTNAGLTIIHGALHRSLGIAADKEIIDREFDIIVPKIADVAPENRANRILPDVRFDARLAGALHKIKINGIVTI